MKNSLKRMAALLLAFLLIFQSGIVSPKLLTEIFAEDNVAQESQEVLPETGEPVSTETTVPVPFKAPEGQESAQPGELDGQEGSDDQEQQPAEEQGQLEGDETGPKGGEGNRDDESPETWTITFYNRDAEVHATVQVVKGEAIGDKLPAVIARDDYYSHWAIGTLVPGGQGMVISKTGDRIDETFVPEADTEIVPDFDKITWTITFYQDDKSTVVDTKTVNVDTSYCLNDIPKVPIKTGYSGKWVYSGGDFNNSVRVSSDIDVWAEYEQTIFTVTFKVEDATYQEDEYDKGDALVLPEDPVVEGKEFVGWYVDETEYEGGEIVDSNLVLTAQFEDEFAVSFVILDDDGNISERLLQYFRTEGETIGTMPQNPFVAGKVFEKWINQDTNEEVTADTIVNGDITAVAVFRTVEVYIITAEYYYEGSITPKVVFNTDIFEVEFGEFPYTITAPASTVTNDEEVSGHPTYYPENQTITVTEENFEDGSYECTVSFKYVPYTAVYDYVYMLLDLNGNAENYDTDYTEIPGTRESDVHGVKGSYVTPTVKSFDFAVLKLAQGANIDTDGLNGNPKKLLYVYYTRKSFQLTYETNGGSYVGGVTVPYGTQQGVTSTVPTRDGYTFAGWFTDEGLTQAAGSTVTINGNTTLYAKWNANTVDYTIVYMFEKYNDAGTQSSYVYDNSETGHGTVGSTIYANDSSIPDKTKKGWEKDTDKNAASSVVITADGSAVLLVYYKLRTYTFTFTIHNSSTNGRYRMTIKGTTYRASDNTKYSFTAKLGQDISADWPINGGNATIWDNNNGSYFYYWRCQGTSYASKILRVTDELLPNSGTSVSVTGYWRNNNNNVQVNYHLQNADDDGYTLSTLYSQSAPSGNYTPKEIAGYTYDHSSNTNSAYNFYYNRHTYQIEYYHGTDKLRTISGVKYDATITSNTYNWTPTQTECGVESDYTWGGWYDNAGCEGDPYTFSKMPAGATNGSVALVLYAKWIAPTYTVTFVDGENVETVYDTKTVEKYKKVSATETTPTKTGYTFEGWYTTADGDALFDWNTQIVENTTVYAHWGRQTLSYTVHYVDEDGNAVAEDKVVSNPNFTVGQSIEEAATAVVGYRPDASSKDLTLTGDSDQNAITFVYTLKAESTSYTIHYILDPNEYTGNIEVAPSTSKTVDGNAASVIASAAAVDYATLYEEHPELDGIEFYPDAEEKSLVLTASAEANVFYFYYSSYKHATVIVHFVDMSGSTIADNDTQILKVGKTFSLSRTPIAGWELDNAVEGTEYNGTEAGSEYKITESITENGLEFTLYYKRKATITAVSDSKQYNGTALTLPVNLIDQVKVEGLLEGDSLASVQYTYTNADSVDGKGRLNAGTATVTPHDAVISGTHAGVNDYYSVHYLSGALEVTKINVTIRIEPDRWTGNVYDGTVYKTGFTNGTKTSIDKYVMISHDGYKSQYLDDVWALVTNLDSVIEDESTPGMHHYVVAEKDVGDYEYNLNLKSADMPNGNGNYSVSLYVRPGRLQILPLGGITVFIQGKQQEDPYDGNEHTAVGYEVTRIELETNGIDGIPETSETDLYKTEDFAFTPGEAVVMVDGQPT
ncbi:MAG: InlB B-repeat-containing protein, partial [Firmicutes bacterium]|nr:InlB B-repeat-containing protein [Bacillota bacterium]